MIAIFLDLAKPFDTVNHAILYTIHILPNVGINNFSLNWFRSYLLNRKQGVNINNVLSQERTNEFGVSQGSILGPILFSLYINIWFVILNLMEQ